MTRKRTLAVALAVTMMLAIVPFTSANLDTAFIDITPLHMPFITSPVGVDSVVDMYNYIMEDGTWQRVPCCCDGDEMGYFGLMNMSDKTWKDMTARDEEDDEAPFYGIDTDGKMWTLVCCCDSDGDESIDGRLVQFHTPTWEWDSVVNTSVGTVGIRADGANAGSLWAWGHEERWVAPTLIGGSNSWKSVLEDYRGFMATPPNLMLAQSLSVPTR